MSREIMAIEVKNGRNWETTHTTTDAAEILRSLSDDLISKKLCKSASIRSITHKYNHDGTATITTDYGNGCRRVYTIKR